MACVSDTAVALCTSHPPIILTVITYQILKLGVEVFLDGQSCVRNSFVQICVKVADHLHHTQTPVAAVLHTTPVLKVICKGFLVVKVNCLSSTFNIIKLI